MIPGTVFTFISILRSGVAGEDEQDRSSALIALMMRDFSVVVCPNIYIYIHKKGKGQSGNLWWKLRSDLVHTSKQKTSRHVT